VHELLELIKLFLYIIQCTMHGLTLGNRSDVHIQKWHVHIRKYVYVLCNFEGQISRIVRNGVINTTAVIKNS